MSTGWWISGLPGAAARSSLWLAAGPVANLTDHERSGGYVGRAGPNSVCAERLSKAFRDLHRPGNPGAGAARPGHSHRFIAPSDGSQDPSDRGGDQGEGRLFAGISLPRAAARVARLAAGQAPARL